MEMKKRCEDVLKSRERKQHRTGKPSAEIKRVNREILSVIKNGSSNSALATLRQERIKMNDSDPNLIDKRFKTLEGKTRFNTKQSKAFWGMIGLYDADKDPLPTSISDTNSRTGECITFNGALAISNGFVQHFEHRGQCEGSKPPTYVEDTDDYISKEVGPSTIKTFSYYNTTWKNRPRGKSPGPDNIPDWFLAMDNPEFRAARFIFYNTCWLLS